MPLTKAGTILQGSAVEAGWTVETQLEVLCQFLDELNRRDPLLLHETFQRFLDDKFLEEDDINAEICSECGVPRDECG